MNYRATLKEKMMIMGVKKMITEEKILMHAYLKSGKEYGELHR